MAAKARWAWHIHHDRLIEPLTEPLARRRAYIRVHKPSSEVALRLRLLRVVKGPLPKSLVQARAAWEKARAAWEKAWAAREKAWAAWEKAWAAREKAWAAWEKARAAWEKAQAAREKAFHAAMPALTRLHAKECPRCPWDGRTIFPAREKKRVT